jgi:hypothetical protein
MTKITTTFSKEGKEAIFDIIDEYMDLKNKHYVIRITDESKAKAFGIMMNVGEGFSGFKKEEYSINGLTKRRLDKNKIKYKVIRT